MSEPREYRVVFTGTGWQARSPGHPRWYGHGPAAQEALASLTGALEAGAGDDAAPAGVCAECGLDAGAAFCSGCRQPVCLYCHLRRHHEWRSDCRRLPGEGISESGAGTMSDDLHVTGRSLFHGNEGDRFRIAGTASERHSHGAMEAKLDALVVAVQALRDEWDEFIAANTAEISATPEPSP